MAVETSPAFQFYVKEWRSSRAIMRMSFAERGIYLEMLLEQWENLTVPATPEECAELIGGSAAEWRKAWPVVSRKFVNEEGRLVNLRLEQERQKQRKGSRRQSDKGKQGAAARWHRHDREMPVPSNGNGAGISEHGFPIPIAIAIATPTKDTRVSAPDSPKKPDPFTDGTVTDRAGRFIERYTDLYVKHRNAQYLVRPQRDYAAAVPLCQTWVDDARLDKIATIFLTTDHQFAESGSRTIPQFAGLASWCDSQLAAWEAKQRTA